MPTISCVECIRDIPFEDDGSISLYSINYYNDCNGNIYNNCNKIRDNKYTENNKNNIKLSAIEPNEELPLLQCSQCKNDLNEEQPV